MDFISVDISILLISLISATLIFIFYISPYRYSLKNSDGISNESFAVTDIVRLLKKVCPVDSGNKWRLLPYNSGLSRCWGKRVQFPGSQSDVKLYGTVCDVQCSSVYAFSLIADVTKFGEWEPALPFQYMSLKPFNDSQLQKDKFMVADQVVGIQRGTNVQSYRAMYRFMSFSDKTVKWILLWNAKKMEFMFFLIQPAVSKTADSQCLITHISGANPALSSVLSVVQRLRNIKDFLILSQLHVIASKYTPAAPIISSHSTTDKMKKKKSLNDQGSSVTSPESISGDIQYKFVLIPIFSNMKYFAKRIKGYRLVIEKEPVKPERTKQKKKERSPADPQNKDNQLKRATSEMYIKPRKYKDFTSSLELHRKGSLDASAKQTTSGATECSYVVAEKLNLSVSETDPNLDSKKRSISEASVSDNQKPPSQSDGSEHHTDEETFINLHIIHENFAQENASLEEEKNNILCSSTSDFELVDSNQQFEDCRIADFLTQGNYGASELQAEMMLASQFDKSLSFEAQSSGGWIFNSTHKGMTVLTKTTAGQFMKIISYLCQIELPVSCNDVWKCVKNPRFRFFSDETVKTVKIVERISNSQKLIHVYHETTGFLKKECIDFCLLQTEREEPNHFYSSYHSIEYEKCPLMTSVIRGSLRPSGWVVENLGPKKCKVTHMIQIIVNSPDSLYIQMLSSLAPMAMHNLKVFTAAKPK